MSKPARRGTLISSAELWLGVEVLVYIVIFAIWDNVMVDIVGMDPATRSTVGNCVLAVAIVFGRRIIMIDEKLSALEEAQKKFSAER